MALGITIGQFVTPNIEAQSNGVFGEIVCKKLTLVDKEGKMAVALRSGGEGNGVIVFDKAGKIKWQAP